MERNLFRYILRYSGRQQIVLLLLTLINMPVSYYSYELPKTIINEAIQGQTKIDGKKVAVEFPQQVYGIGPHLDQLSYLLTYCFIFLFIILILQGLKYVSNVYRGVVGERMLRRLRYQLYHRVLRFPQPTFRKMSQGEIISMITGEVEPIGGFVADSFALPAMQGGTMLVILGFLVVADPFLAAAAVALYPIQFYIIPKLQRRVNKLGKERVKRVRLLSQKIGETVSGSQEIHVHDTSNYELARFAQRMHEIFTIRLQIYIWKFVIKFVNNFIQQLGPFFFYSIGGYLVLEGQLDIGTLVAAIAAHKDLGAPWKELLAYYQQQQDARIKYEQVVEQFDPAGIIPEERQLVEPAERVRLQGELTVAGLSLADDTQVPIVDNVAITGPVARRVALVGGAGSGREELAMLLARALEPERGTISIGGTNMLTQPEAVTGRRISFVGPSPYVFNMSLGDNLYYGLRHRPRKEKVYEGEAAKERERYIEFAAMSGNIDYDPAADWIDYGDAGVEDMAGLRREAIRVLQLVGLDDDVYSFGLRGSINPKKRPDVVEGVLKARKALKEKLDADPGLAVLVERFDPDSYNTNASVIENLMFGIPYGDAFDVDRPTEHPYIREVLDRVGLTRDMVAMGYQAAATMVELFSDLPPDHELFQQYSFVSADDLPVLQALLAQYSREQLDTMKPADQNMLMSLPFKLIPARHRLGIIEEQAQARLLEARKAFAENLPDDLKSAIAFFNADEFNPAANLLDNILFGKIAFGQAQAQERVNTLMKEVMTELGIIDTVSEVGLDYDVGNAGARLSAAQRQKLALARALLKRPDMLVLSDATAVLDTSSQTRILNGVLDEYADRGLVWGVHRAAMAERFDYVLVMKGGRIVEKGTFADLNRGGTALAELIAAEAG